MKQIVNLKRSFSFSNVFANIIVFLFFLPVVLIVSGMFINTNPDNWYHITTFIIPQQIKTTVMLIIAVMTASTVLAFSVAYLISFYSFPGSKQFESLLLLPFTIPAYIGTYAYNKVFDYSGPINSWFRDHLDINYLLQFDLFSFSGAVFVFTLFFYPYLYISLLGFFRKYSGELIQVSRTLGVGSFSIITRIILPLSRTALISGLTLISMEVLNDFGVSSYLGIQTFSSGIFKAWIGMNDIVSAIKLAAYIVPIILFILLVFRYFSDKTTITYLATGPNSFRKLQGIKALGAFVYCSIILFLGYLLPLLIIIRYTLIVINTSDITGILNVTITGLILTGTSTILILILGTYLAYCTRSKTKIYGELFSLQYSLPGTLIAVAVMFLFYQFENFYILPKGTTIVMRNSYALLIFAYIMRFLTLGYNTAGVAFKKIGFSYRNAAKTLNCNPLTCFFKIELPIILPSLKYGGLLILIDIFKELPLTLFLRPFNFNTPASKVHDLAVNEMFAESTPFALVLIMILGIIIIQVIQFKKKDHL
ncbi:MAG: ABC transporter permease [Brevinemataceae bacterium]